MLAAYTSESIFGGESPSAGGRQGEQASSEPTLAPRGARATLKGPWQTPSSRRARSLAVIHAAAFSSGETWGCDSFQPCRAARCVPSIKQLW